MANTALIVSPDTNAVQVLQRILEDRGIRVEHSAVLQSAADRLVDRFNLVFVDCENEPAALALMVAIRARPAYASALIVAMVDARNEIREMFARGASFMLYKPITPERTSNSLRAAWAMMPGERRRKRRAPVNTRAAISYATVEDTAAPVLNLSGDGIAILSSRSLPLPSKVYFQFALPGQEDPLRLSGEVVWQDARGQVGLQFAHVPQASRRQLEDWLQANLVLHARSADSRPVLQTFAGAAEEAFSGDRGTRAERKERIGGPPDRRMQSRRTCRMGVNVSTPAGKVLQHCTMTDLSAGGCYIETTHPLAAEARLMIEVRTLDLKLTVRGKVKAAHRGYGMGVEFIVRTPEEREQVRQLLAYQNSLIEAELQAGSI